AEQAERKKTAQAFGQEVRYQLGRLSYPFTLELASACDSFIVRQDDARTVSVFLRVTNLGVPAPKPGKQEAAAAEPETEKADVPGPGTETEKASEPAIGFRRALELSEDDVFLGSVEGERVPIKCFGNAIALFGKWKPSESAKANIRLVRSNLTSDDLESFNG